MNGLIVIGHPSPSSFSHALASRVAESWSDAGVNVVLIDLALGTFDPCLTPAEAREGESLDATVLAHRLALAQADYLAVLHPIMWAMPPAILKGWVDRVFAPGLAYQADAGADGGVRGLLRTRAALILNTSNTDAAQEMARFGDPMERIWRDCILGFCGIRRVERRCFAPLSTSSVAERAAYLNEAADLAKALLA